MKDGLKREYLNLRKMCIIYQVYLDSTDVCSFPKWLNRHFNFSDYQIKRLVKFSKSEKAKSICYNMAMD